MALTAPDIPRLDAIVLGRRSGKVREVYDLSDCFLIVSTDRISAFDVVMPTGIPDKGRVLNQMSAFWFNKLADVIQNHVLATDDLRIAERVGFDDPSLRGRSMLAKKADPLSIECVVRAYIAGSLLKEYRSAVPKSGIVTIHGNRLPSGLQSGAKLPEPIFTPATKAESGHDENISFVEAANRVGASIAEEARRHSLAVFARASAHSEDRGLILADTKFEFGICDSGLMWIDEALTPDSSRYWEADEPAGGGARPGFDKQFVRDWLEATTWDKQPPAPPLPDGVIAKTRQKYLTAYERITRMSLET